MSPQNATRLQRISRKTWRHGWINRDGTDISRVTSGIVIWWLMKIDASEPWVWLTIFSGYVPLFAPFIASHRMDPTAARARRELWSIWIGHLVSTFFCLLVIRILCQPDFDKTIEFSYPCWACISSLAFFAKSGNFWSAYRWVGSFWALAAVLLTITPAPSIVYAAFAALTCFVIALSDPSFLNDSISESADHDTGGA